ncbi:MOSC domain-containing protein [Capillimicrobium parvum]|uniref:MOSC domain-containing protein n=1 Tax=Capillimicrobium parvum TaxID=2884022 RepID=A0A9E7C1C6_9ACTN|nr:MOSC domain-containing protein [Capillimicrobium parvum]UGS37276.1 hypothetical protein DSM104329_03691 [Capillimicrobium parvum]
MTDLVVTRLATTPIKGLRMNERDEIALGPAGVAGDRAFFLVDVEDRIRSVTLVGALVRMRADYDPASSRLTVVAGDGSEHAGDVRLGEAVTGLDFGGGPRPGREVLGAWSALFSEAAGESLRLVKVDDAAVGTDVAPVTLLGEGSLAELERRSGLGPIDPRRFRMLIQFASDEPRVEETWEGREIAVGEARLRVGGTVPRCAATTRHPEQGDRDAPIVRAIRDYRGVQETGLGRGVPFGVYAEVLRGGRVRVGDRIDAG